MDKTNVPKITNKENLLFECLNIFKYLDIEFISENIYPGKPYYYVARRISQLEFHEYISSIRMYEMDSHNSTTGRKIIMSYDGAEDFLKFNLNEVTSTQKRNFSHYIAHQLFLAKALFPYYNSENFIDQHEVSFVKLLSENELSLSGRQNNFRPDGGFVLNVDGNNIMYFVEAERSYASESNIIRKVFKQYNNVVNVMSNLKFVEELDIKTARVLFISSSKNKMNNLIKKINEINLDVEIDMLFIYLDKLLDNNIDNILDVNYIDKNSNAKKIFIR